ncbi:Cytochrome P450-like protein 18 [Elsinoe fawcettii]|nr:Cytochrome P450-like protein 18 [Elsinoe fawcettii]
MSSVRSAWARDTWYLTGRFNPYHDNMFTVLEPKAHAKARARKIGGYSGREIPMLEAEVDTLVTTLITMIRDKYARNTSLGTQAVPLDLGSITNYYTLDIIMRLAFGKEIGYLRDSTDHFNFFRILRSLWPQMSTSADVPWIRKLLFSPFVLGLLGPKTTDKDGFGALMRVAEEQVGRRFQGGADAKQDMMGSFIRQGHNQQECEVEGLFMIVGGTESTASALRSILVHIMTCPRVYQTLKKEISNAVQSGSVSSPITVEHAKRLPFLQAVIYEGIRMRPPLLGIFPKVVPAGGAQVLGFNLPPGTSVAMNISALLRSTAMFGPDADLYRPERFMELEQAERTQMERNVELAFGSGQNMCVGKNIAFMQLNKAVFELLRAFDLQIVDPLKPCDSVVYGIFLETNLMVRATEAFVVGTEKTG